MYGFHQFVCRHPSNFFNLLGRILSGKLGEALEADRPIVHELFIYQTVANEHIDEAQSQGTVAARAKL